MSVSPYCVFRGDPLYELVVYVLIREPCWGKAEMMEITNMHTLSLEYQGICCEGLLSL